MVLSEILEIISRPVLYVLIHKYFVCTDAVSSLKGCDTRLDKKYRMEVHTRYKISTQSPSPSLDRRASVHDVSYLIFLNQPASLSMRFRQYVHPRPTPPKLPRPIVIQGSKRKGDSLIFQTLFSSHCNTYTSLPLFSPASCNTNSIAHDG